jgi:putative transposase
MMLGYRSNNNVVYSSKYHVVWCPKYRRKVLVDAIAKRAFELIHKAAARYRAEVIAREIMPDHVHLLVEVDPQLGIHRLVKYIKGVTSHDLRKEFPSLTSRLPSLWTNSYFVSTVGGAPLEVIKQYVENQKKI